MAHPQSWKMACRYGTRNLRLSISRKQKAMKRTNASSNALPIIAAPLKYSDAVMWFSDLCQLEIDGCMEFMEGISSKTVRAGTMPARCNPKWNCHDNSSAEFQAISITVWISCLG